MLILLKTALPLRPFKCDNFEPTSTKLVVTEADIERRIVKELNAEPAAKEYPAQSACRKASSTPMCSPRIR